MSDIIDNRRVRLADVALDAFKASERSDIATGYLFLSGLHPFVKELPKLKEVRILMGQVTDQATVDFLAYGILDEDEAVREQKRLDRAGLEKRQKRREDVLMHTRQRIGYLKPSPENEETLTTLLGLLRDNEGKEPILKVKVYTKARLHAKAYLFDYKQEHRNHITGAGIGIVGSSNLTLSGLTSNTELNVKVHGDANHKALKDWFEDLWKDAEDFSADLMQILENSWAAGDYSPFDIWCGVLKEYVGDLPEEDEWKNIREAEFPDLTRFQKEAVENATRILEKYDGVFVSDVVGLGKSYIGAYLMKRWTRRPGYQAGVLVVCPAALTTMWKEIMAQFGIPGHVVSMQRLSTEEGYLRSHYRHIRLVLIDESHHFRNLDIKRFKELASFTQVVGKKCILLSATPLNKGATDIKHQMRLFHPENPTEVPIEPNHIDKFFQAVKRREDRLQTIRDHRQPTPEDLRVQANEARLRDLLKHILIRRTRRHIEKNYDERTEEELKQAVLFQDDKDDPRYIRPYFTLGGQKVTFPVRELHTQKYSIEAVYEGVYTDILEKLKRLQFARYSLGGYVLPEKQHLEQYQDLNRAGKALLPLIKVGLLKRFESSVEAFRRTVGRMFQAHELFAKTVKRGQVPLGKEVQRMLYQAEDWEDDEDLVEALVEGSKAYPASDFDAEALLTAIHHDAKILEVLLKSLEPIDPEEDDKLVEIQRLLVDEIKDEKVLIFTEYRDTAIYLKRHLELPNLEQVDSGTKNRLQVLKHFSPRSNNFKPPNGNEIQILIATDVFSEGLNLQDCGRIINYDLHWNPVRLIQRIGRIDRIGSLADRIHVYNFLPEAELEKHLSIHAVLSHRIQEIHDNLGEDEKILSEAEQLNEESMYAIYEKGDLDSVEDSLEDHDLFGIPDLLAELRRFETMRQQWRLPPLDTTSGMRGRNREKKPLHVAAFRCGDLVRFFVSNNGGEPEHCDDERALALLRPNLKGKQWADRDSSKGKGDHRPQGPVTAEHRAFLAKAWERMDEYRHHRSQVWTEAGGQTPGHRYVLEILQLFLVHGSPTMQEEDQVDKVIRILKDENSRVVRKRLRQMKERGLLGRDILLQCLQLIEEQDLVQAYEDRMNVARSDAPEPIRIIASVQLG